MPVAWDEASRSIAAFSRILHCSCTRYGNLPTVGTLIKANQLCCSSYEVHLYSRCNGAYTLHFLAQLNAEVH